MALKWVLANDANDKIDKGQITINQNTTFTGDATFLSKGTEESITINSGSIVFKRNDIPLTTIKNIRFGSITTDYNGKGRVSFQGFKKPILILPSIKSFTSRSGSNIASLYCYTEEIESENNTYKFVIKATSEYHTPPTDIKVMDTNVSIDNSIGHTWKDYGFKIKGYSTGWIDGYTYYNSIPIVSPSFFKKPTINILCNQVINGKETTILNKNIIMTPTLDTRYGQYAWVFNSMTITEVLNKYYEYARSNVNLVLKVTIIEPNLGVKEWSMMYSVTSGSGNHYTRWAKNASREFKVLNSSNIYDYFITYSYEMSKISDPYGEGEVQYIAMEIDDR